MTKKHYEAMARILSHARAYTEDAETMRQYIRDQFAIMASQDNDRFNVDHFMKACDVNGGDS